MLKKTVYSYGLLGKRLGCWLSKYERMSLRELENLYISKKLLKIAKSFREYKDNLTPFINEFPHSTNSTVNKATNERDAPWGRTDKEYSFRK